MTEVTEDDIGAALMGMIHRIDAETASMSEDEIRRRWFYDPKEGERAEFALYRFFDALSLYARSCRRWEEIHNGSSCVVERVRDKYLMPKLAEFARTFPTPPRESGNGG